MRATMITAWCISGITLIWAFANGLVGSEESSQFVCFGDTCLTASPRNLVWIAILAAVIGLWAWYEQRKAARGSS